ncbi:MAG: squalene/phytoene synthase family protein [Alphaproteobacteria bacterium]|nr:squalene/phytoene synthase family protein [Alphaproteobacteria bacterium]
MTASPFATCEELVRRHDPDRYVATLFAPAAKRPFLFALYAFYYEVARVPVVAHEPMIGAIRLAWWQETVDGARAGSPRPHDVARALCETLAVHDLPAASFARIIDGRHREVDHEPFADTEEATAHAEGTSGTLMGLAARILGGASDELAREAGIAYALAGRRGAMFAKVETELPAAAKAHLAAARRQAIPPEALAAFLPASLVGLYLKRADPPLWRKQITLFLAAKRGRL